MNKLYLFVLACTVYSVQSSTKAVKQIFNETTAMECGRLEAIWGACVKMKFSVVIEFMHSGYLLKLRSDGSRLWAFLDIIAAIEKSVAAFFDAAAALQWFDAPSNIFDFFFPWFDNCLCKLFSFNVFLFVFFVFFFILVFN